MKPKQKSVVKSILNCDFVEGGSLSNKGFTKCTRLFCLFHK